MMFASIVAIALAVIPRASAHFQINYPAWRADTVENDTYSQWTWPCGGVPDHVGNRTDWAINGGAVQLTLHHPWSYLWINLGLGNEVTNFNLTMAPELMNVTGRGKFCLDNLHVPMDVADGTNASIQVITAGGGDSGEGSALYNCADVTLRTNAPVPDGMCKNDTTMSVVMLGQQWEQQSSNATGNGTGTGASVVTVTVTAASNPTSTTNSAMAKTAGGVTLIGVVGLASVLAVGLGL
ncbi:hypothetical protein F5Y05DRAFT_50195 [Hypoxylon sp. FL0543]|nr:hypothetical protein F5Y05DRAFT_50195 [Hypoxylon sp. FL0543]